MNLAASLLMTALRQRLIPYGSSPPRSDLASGRGFRRMRQVWSGKSDETADGTVIDLDLEAQHPHYLQAGRIRQLVDQHWNLHSGPSG